MPNKKSSNYKWLKVVLLEIDSLKSRVEKLEKTVNYLSDEISKLNLDAKTAKYKYDFVQNKEEGEKGG
jgi:cell division protein FtsB